ncbi:leader peptidase (prepilin peptidase) / N-methyltransferase [Sphingomonas sp. NFR04]|uniref:prepilin peptidase n=1 Tax=Sphingomonas sp. NFR04 TaxID=1566283 RepID=UPI0008E21E45|nr:A24 family peptidase [Sphingomonas sp. NFR04]SFI96049.1 leader peptidase (prepilin peptidase) / N-methyltransferase [Sphingomonas sp. NFR04]
MTPLELWGWPILLGVLGAVFGSFIATIAIRWPEGRSVARGRSACDSCGTPLGAAELVPVLSYLVQRGRCSHCSARIAPSHWLTEVLGLAIGGIAGLAAPGVEGAAGAVFGWLLLALAALDLAAFWLPNGLNAALALVGLGVGAMGIGAPLPERVIGGIAGFAVLWLVARGYKALRGRQGLGGGDPKLFGAIGCWLGWENLPMVLLAASLIGLAAVLALLVVGRRVRASDRLPFGVMLALGAWAVWLAPQLVPPATSSGEVPTWQLAPIEH